MEATIEAAAAVVGEQRGPEAAARLRLQFGKGQVSVQVYDIVPGSEHWVHKCCAFGGDMCLAVHRSRVSTGATIVHEMAHVLLRHGAERQRYQWKLQQDQQAALAVFTELEAEVVTLALLAK